MGTAISCIECSQVTGLIQKVGRSSLKALSLCAAVLCSKIIVIILVMYYQCTTACVHVYRSAGDTGMQHVRLSHT